MTRAEKLEELVRLMRQLRDAQKTYFSRRDRDSLIAAKELERMVDDALAWLPAPSKKESL
jgi:hypothetical protein